MMPLMMALKSPSRTTLKLRDICSLMGVFLLLLKTIPNNQFVWHRKKGRQGSIKERAVVWESDTHSNLMSTTY
jgi:hypothetical protein